MRKDLQFGLIYGLAGAVWVLIMWAIGMHDADANISMSWIESIYLVVAAVIITFGMKSVKKENGGFLTIGQGFKVGAVIVLIGQLISTLFGYIYQNLINTTYVEAKAEQMRQAMMTPEALAQLEASGISPEEYLSMMMDRMTGPMAYLWSFLGGVILMLLVTLVIAAIVQKKKPHTNEPTKEEIEEFLNDGRTEIEDDDDSTDK
jgi:cytochrome bd-type quinol oxidase subunit 2